MDIVNQLTGVYFSWIDDEVSGLKFNDKRQIGVIAQDVQKVLPEAISNIYNGNYLGVRYSDIVPVLLQSIKELEIMVDDLQSITDQLSEDFTTLNLS